MVARSRWASPPTWCSTTPRTPRSSTARTSPPCRGTPRTSGASCPDAWSRRSCAAPRRSSTASSHEPTPPDRSLRPPRARFRGGPVMRDAPTWVPVAILFAILLLAYLGMWRGWRRRAHKHDLPPLVEEPAVADLPPATLQSGARYFGTTTSGSWLDRVVARGLGARSSCRLSLSA